MSASASPMMTLSAGVVDKLSTARMLPAMVAATGCIDAMIDAWLRSVTGAPPIRPFATKISGHGAVTHTASAMVTNTVSYINVARAGHAGSVARCGSERKGQKQKP